MPDHRLEFTHSGSSKFWEVTCAGSKTTVRYGKIGTNGQQTVKDHGSAAKAQKFALKKKKEKMKKGYAEVNDEPEAPSTYLEVPGQKFWKIELVGSQTTVTYGKLGASGQTTMKDHGTDAKAQKFYDKMVKNKKKKGYVEASDGNASSKENDCPEPPAKRRKLNHTAKPVGVKLEKGQVFSIPDLDHVYLEDQWSWNGGRKYLDAALLMFDDRLKCHGHLDYCNTNCMGMSHSGDKLTSSKGTHKINIQLSKVPAKVTRIVMTLSAWNSAKLGDIKNPRVKLLERGCTQELCSYSVSGALQKYPDRKCIILCELFRSGNGWSLRPVEDICDGDVSNYSKIEARIRVLYSKAPILWKMPLEADVGYGLYVDDTGVYVGDEKGLVTHLDHDGSPQANFKLPSGVKCIVRDGHWLYCGTNDGGVYDLTGKVPRSVTQLEQGAGKIYWMDIHRGLLGVSDSEGNVAVVDPEGEIQWNKKSPGTKGWMLRMDGTGLYHGHSAGVTKYDLQGGKVWNTKLPEGREVLFGWQEGDAVYTSGPDKLQKGSGKLVASYNDQGNGCSCCTSEAGKLVFVENAPGVAVFREDGELLYKLDIGDILKPMSMQVYDNKLYLVSDHLSVIDLSETARKAATAGSMKSKKVNKASAGKAVVADSVGVQAVKASDVGDGCTLHVIKVGGKLKVRPEAGQDYDEDMNCQFPRALRVLGARFCVPELIDAGAFYRVKGEIKKIE